MGSDRTFGQLVADYLISAVEADGTFVRITGPETEDRYAAAIGRQVARTLVPWGPRQGVKGQRDFLLGGQQISLSADT